MSEFEAFADGILWLFCWLLCIAAGLGALFFVVWFALKVIAFLDHYERLSA